MSGGSAIATAADVTRVQRDLDAKIPGLVAERLAELGADATTEDVIGVVREAVSEIVEQALRAALGKLGVK